MSRKLTALFVAAAMFSSLTAATTVFAEQANPSPEAPSTQGMMGDHGGMMNMMGQMSSDHMKQMTRMVENCNRMMESMNHTSNQQPAPDTHQ
jgi:hypothetical protein